MIKKVNVYPVYPILTIKNPIYHTTLNIDLSVGDIERCIFSRAKVEEVLPNGKLLVLNLKNYNKCNFLEEHNSNLVASSPEVEDKKQDTIEIVEEVVESGSEVEEATENQVENLEAISPAEIPAEDEQISEVEENLVAENNVKRNKKNKK